MNSEQPGQNKSDAGVTLETDVQFLRGVGPRKAAVFNKLGVKCAGDLLEYFPRSYEFRPPFTMMNELFPDHNVTVAGEIVQMRFNARSRPPRMDVTLEDPTGRCRLVWFHGGYLRDKFFPEDKIAAWGKIARYKDTLQITNPGWKEITDIDQVLQEEGHATPVYPASGDLNSPSIARAVHQSLDSLLPSVPERYREDYRKKCQILSRREALEWIHRPANQEQIDQARRTLIYDELFLMELGVGLKREHARHTLHSVPMKVDEILDKRIRRLFPFDLTDDQNKVITEVCADMARPRPMNRLLQGDVGSGKTVVALYAALLAVGHHKQVAIMAPTEILAEQHFLAIDKFLIDSKVKHVLIKGGITGKQRAEVLQQIKEGEFGIIVGTQALLQKDLEFKDLALVVVDEQHKFGVRQRQTIRSKELAPHYLVMTATPIPRTLAMTVFGDLDISTINHLPPGRSPIKTHWVKPEKLTGAYGFIREHVNQGEQVYFVYPRVAESEKDPENEETIFDGDSPGGNGQLKAAITEYEKLKNDIFPEFTVGLLHGQMDAQQKQQTMDDFRRHKIDILVATVVIEVGVDVPNATIMVIEHAEQFGLAQLHQLRGRIGRGKKQSFCFLFGEAKTEEAVRRLEMMVKSNDGFRIAEEDLAIRGPGEFFGTSQHGLPDLKIANLIRDIDLLRMAQREAFALAKQDPRLKAKENQQLRKELIKQFGKDMLLVDVG